MIAEEEDDYYPGAMAIHFRLFDLPDEKPGKMREYLDRSIRNPDEFNIPPSNLTLLGEIDAFWVCPSSTLVRRFFKVCLANTCVWPLSAYRSSHLIGRCLERDFTSCPSQGDFVGSHQGRTRPEPRVDAYCKKTTTNTLATCRQFG